MIPIYEKHNRFGKGIIHVEITNACIHQCANCTRLAGHHAKPFFMDMDTIKKSLESLADCPLQVGIMGGEPMLHPKFREICRILQKIIPDKTRREICTCGYKWEEYKDILFETFDLERIAYNNHSTYDGKHEPVLVAVKDLIGDKKEMMELIDGCWVEPRWAGSITPKGGYFCEVAGAIDTAFDTNHGFPIEKGWWKRPIEDFKDQKENLCAYCGLMIPVGESSDRATYDLMSDSNFERLKEIGSPKVLAGNYALYNKKWTMEEIKEKSKNWEPYNWRGHNEHCPEDNQKYLDGIREDKTENSKDKK